MRKHGWACQSICITVLAFNSSGALLFVQPHCSRFVEWSPRRFRARDEVQFSGPQSAAQASPLAASVCHSNPDLSSLGSLRLYVSSVPHLSRGSRFQKLARRELAHRIQLVPISNCLTFCAAPPRAWLFDTRLILLWSL